MITEPDDLMAALDVMDERWEGYQTAKQIIRQRATEMREEIERLKASQCRHVHLSRYTDEDIQDALELAKPGRMLPLDNEGNMSANGVKAVIHNLTALAREYEKQKSDLKAAREEIERLKNNQCSHVHLSSDKEDPDLVAAKEDIARITEKHDKTVDALAAAHDEIERLKAEQGYDRHTALEAALKTALSELRQARHDLGVAEKALGCILEVDCGIHHTHCVEDAQGIADAALSAIKSPAKEKEGKP